MSLTTYKNLVPSSDGVFVPANNYGEQLQGGLRAIADLLGYDGDQTLVIGVNNIEVNSISGPGAGAVEFNGSVLKMLGHPLNMNDGGGLGGGTLNMDNGSIAGVASITPGGEFGWTAMGVIHMGGNSIAMNDDNGSGGGTLNMDNGSIVSAGNLTFSAGKIIDLTNGDLANVGDIGGDTLRFISGIELADGVGFSAGETTGSLIGTSGAQMLGFWGATPIVRPVMATGTGKTVDNLITMLQAIGLCQQA